MNQRRVVAALGTAAMLLSVRTLTADVMGSILGVVRDPSSAVVAGASITIVNLETNLTRTTLADSSGEYRVLALPVGHYRVEARAPGFQKFLANEVVVDVNQQRRVDITLQVGAV